MMLIEAEDARTLWTWVWQHCLLIETYSVRVRVLLFKISVRTSEKTTLYHYGTHLLNAVEGKLSLFDLRISETHKYTLVGKNSELPVVKSGGTCSFHWVTKRLSSHQQNGNGSTAKWTFCWWVAERYFFMSHCIPACDFYFCSIRNITEAHRTYKMASRVPPCVTKDCR